VRIWRLKIKMDPVTASRPIPRGHGKTRYPKKYEKFKSAAPHFVNAACFGVGLVRPLDGQLAVAIRMIAEQPKKTILDRPQPDVDNYAKAVLDACNGIVWNDDIQVASLAIVKQWAPRGKPGHIELFVTDHHDDETNILPERLFRAIAARGLPPVQ
jgi:Holliday junction resolvase RusA-like endonuclease